MYVAKIPGFKYVPPKDDAEKLDTAIRHRVIIGKKVHVSLGGMRQAAVLVISKNNFGIVAEDEDGQRYNIGWHHVLGGVSDDKAPPDSMTKSVVMIEANAAKDLLKSKRQKAAQAILNAEPPDTGRYPSQFDALAAELRTLDFSREQSTLKKSMEQALADRLPAQVVARLELLHENASAKLVELGAN